MRKVLRSVHVQTSARFEIPRKNNRHKTGFFRKRDLSGQPSNVCHYSRGEGRDTFFSVVLGLQSFSASSAWNARKVSNSQPKPLTIRNFPASSLEHLIFCQPARFLWGTDKVRNRFVGCSCLLKTRACHSFFFLFLFNKFFYFCLRCKKKSTS